MHYARRAPARRHTQAGLGNECLLERHEGRNAAATGRRALKLRARALLVLTGYFASPETGGIIPIQSKSRTEITPEITMAQVTAQISAATPVVIQAFCFR